MKCEVTVVQLCPTFWDPMNYTVHGILQARILEWVGIHFSRIFPTQRSNPGLPHCRRILYHLSHQGNPWILEWVAYSFSSRSSWPRNKTEVSCIEGGFFTNGATREPPFLVQGPFFFLFLSFFSIWINELIFFIFFLFKIKFKKRKRRQKIQIKKLNWISLRIILYKYSIIRQLDKHSTHHSESVWVRIISEHPDYFKEN